MPGETGPARPFDCDGGVRRPVVSAMLALSVVLSVAVPPAGGQSAGDLAAWDALMVTPIGALPPRVHDPLYSDGRRTELAFRYGRWRYDQDDAIHNDFGFTFARALGFANTSLSATAAYLSLSCGTCGSWISGGLEAQTLLISHQVAGDSVRDVTASATLITTAGAARYLGEGRASAGSFAGSASFALVFPLGSTRMLVAILPGMGVGRFASIDQDAYGTRPIFGATAAWILPWGMVADLGFRHVYIGGGPNEIGLGLSWRP